MNRPMPRGDFRYRGSDSSRPSRFGGAMPRARGLVVGVAGDRRQAKIEALNVSQHGGFERKRTPPAQRETVAPLETLCATSVRMGEIVGQCY
jgi:hypothetical protein